eukprot:Skav201221  [mRNA]  locus=scaffold651:545524:548862:- [translate_table: standard]
MHIAMHLPVNIGTLMLAVWGQAMNTWHHIVPHQERDLLLAQLHDYSSKASNKDDSEHLGGETPWFHRGMWASMK